MLMPMPGRLWCSNCWHVHGHEEMSERCFTKCFLPKALLWYSTVPLDHDKLNSMVKTMMNEACAKGYYTNHSLQATAVSRLFQNDLDNIQIKGVTGYTYRATKGKSKSSYWKLLKLCKDRKGKIAQQGETLIQHLLWSCRGSQGGARGARRADVAIKGTHGAQHEHAYNPADKQLLKQALRPICWWQIISFKPLSKRSPTTTVHQKSLKNWFYHHCAGWISRRGKYTDIIHVVKATEQITKCTQSCLEKMRK